MKGPSEESMATLETRLPTVLAGRPRPYLMAHRGASARAPENTLAAFQIAIDAGVELIETDLWFTADEQLVCHHDATLDRLTGLPGRVDQLTLAEIQARPLRAPWSDRFPHERIPSLAQLLALAPGEVILVLELKDPRFAEARWARKLTAQIAERIAARTVIVISFHLERVLAARATDPRLPTGFIAARHPFPTQPVDVLGPFWPLLVVNPFYVSLAHRRGRWVCPLDLAPHRRLGWYRRLGVDAILTDDPQATAHLLGRT